MMHHKIFAFLLLITFSLAGNLQAQEKTFEPGVKAGLNAYSINAGMGMSTNKLAYHGGGYVNINLNESFSIKPEVLYSVQGTDWKLDSMKDYTFTYVNVPVLAKFRLTDGLSFVTGPQVGILISEDVPEEEEDFLFNGDKVSTQDISAVYGFEYEFDFGLNAGLRYQLGLTPLDGKRENTEKANEGVTNRGLQFSLGYTF